MIYQDDDALFGECDPIGEPLYQDLDGKKFYSGVIVHNLTVKYGDCVRVNLETDEDEEDDKNKRASSKKSEADRVVSSSDSFGFCQIFAIFEDPNSEKGVQFEAKWFLTPDEIEYALASKKKRMKLEFQPHELVETDTFDDIPVGSIAEIIQIQFGVTHSARESTAIDANASFLCRYRTIGDNHSLHAVDSFQSSFNRGLASSEYKVCYEEYLRKNVELATALGVRTALSASLSDSIDSTGQGIPGHGHGGAAVYDPFDRAIRQLHMSVIPERLTGRESERDKIESMLLNGIRNRGSMKPLYISGMPGTGKTATVLSTIRQLQRDAKAKLISEFTFVEINCLRLHSPSDAYTVLWRALSGQHASNSAARNYLTDYYLEANAAIRNAKPVAICLLDEIDFIITKDENVIYNFIEWSLHFQSNLFVVGISNFSDLPERLSNRVQSRMGRLERIIFNVYEYRQVQSILMARLSDLADILFDPRDPKIVEFLSRKAAGVAGDLRAALKICQRAIELLRVEIKQRSNAALLSSSTSSSLPSSASSELQQTQAQSIPQFISRSIVIKAAEEYNQNPFRATIRLFCALDKAIIVCACKHQKATGDLEMTTAMLWLRLQDLIRVIFIANSTELASKRTVSSGSTAVGEDCESDDEDDDNRESEQQLITLLLPPYTVFEQAIYRLIEHGIFKLSGNKGVASITFLRLCKFKMRPEIADIVAALRGGPFAKYTRE